MRVYCNVLPTSSDGASFLEGSLDHIGCVYMFVVDRLKGMERGGRCERVLPAARCIFVCGLFLGLAEGILLIGLIGC